MLHKEGSKPLSVLCVITSEHVESSHLHASYLTFIPAYLLIIATNTGFYQKAFYFM